MFSGSGAGAVLRGKGMSGVMAGALLLAAAGFDAGTAHAQDWFTPEICETGEIGVWPGVLSQSDEARLEALAADVPNGLGRFWKITAPGGQVSHLWGTYHVPDRAILDLPQAFRDVLEVADVVALEFDPLPETRDEIRRTYDQGWMWRGFDLEDDLRTDFPPRYLDYIGQRIAIFGWSAEFLPQMTDAAVLSLLLSDPCSDYLSPLMPTQDSFIAQTGWLAGADVTGLEESWAFGEALTEPHRADQARAAALLYALYLGPESAVKGVRETSFALYLEGRIGVLDAWANEWPRHVLGEERGRKVVQLADDYLLVERNAIWMERIRDLVDAGGAVIAVGASHLPGDLGMVTLMRDAGYQVERVVLPGERLAQ